MYSPAFGFILFFFTYFTLQLYRSIDVTDTSSSFELLIHGGHVQ